jgi:hypothetical protein
LVLGLKDASPHEAMVTLRLISQSLLEASDDSAPRGARAASGSQNESPPPATASPALGVLRLDDRDFTLLINAAAKAKDWRLALRLLRQLEKTPVGNSVRSSSSSSSASAASLCLQPNVFHYTAAIGACRAAGSAAKEPLAYAAALELFAEMKSRGVLPNAYTYTNVLSATCDGNLAAALLEEMATHNLQPDVFHYSAAVAAADRGGQWEVRAFASPRCIYTFDPTVCSVHRLLVYIYLIRWLGRCVQSGGARTGGRDAAPKSGAKPVHVFRRHPRRAFKL